jgi:hypothetical protein
LLDWFQVILRWRRGQEELIEGLFNWLVPPLISVMQNQCRPPITPIPNALIRCHFFSSWRGSESGHDDH